MLASLSPTYLSKICGPFTILGSRAFNIFPIWRAMRVLPVPGGPYNKIPFTCLHPKIIHIIIFYTSIVNFVVPSSLLSLGHYFFYIMLKDNLSQCVWVHIYRVLLYLPNCSTTSGGKTREAKARRKIALNSLSRPPIPILPKSQSGLMIDWRGCFLFYTFCEIFVSVAWIIYFRCI